MSSSLPESSGVSSQLKSWWQRLSPDWKSAIIFGTMWAILDVLKYSTGGLAFMSFFPIFVGLALLQGVIVARYASNDNRYTQANYLRLGVLSGFWVFVIDMVVGIVVIAVMFGATLGVALALIPAQSITMLISDMITILMPGIGAWAYSKYGGQKLLLTLIGIGCGCMIIVLVLIAAAIAILAAIGITILPQFVQ
jgi:hypothetical protein